MSDHGVKGHGQTAGLCTDVIYSVSFDSDFWLTAMAYSLYVTGDYKLKEEMN